MYHKSHLNCLWPTNRSFRRILKIKHLLSKQISLPSRYPMHLIPRNNLSQNHQVRQVKRNDCKKLKKRRMIRTSNMIHLKVKGQQACLNSNKLWMKGVKSCFIDFFSREIKRSVLINWVKAQIVDYPKIEILPYLIRTH